MLQEKFPIKCAIDACTTSFCRYLSCFISSENRPKSMEFDTTDDETLFDYLKQPMFLSHLTWFSFVQLRFLYFVGNLNSLLNRMLDNNISQGRHTSNQNDYE